MTIAPPVWSEGELAREAAIAAERFRAERLSATADWDVHVERAKAKFERLRDALDDLRPDAASDECVAVAFGDDLREALRYLAGPPISDDDLKVVADVASLSPGGADEGRAARRKAFAVVERIIDAHRFPWRGAGSPPSDAQRHAAVLASSILLAAQRSATGRRSEGKNAQEKEIKRRLLDIGFGESPAVAISTAFGGPGRGRFCGECMLGERKADVVARLDDDRLLAIECKVSNSATNSIKRLNNDAAVKAEHWKKKFGELNVVPAAALAGVFKPLNLKQAQDRGLTLFWSHDLDALAEFIRSAR